MKKILLVAIAVMLVSPLKADAFSFGDFFRKLFGVSKEETTVEKLSIKESTEKTLSEYISEAEIIDNEVQNSFISVVSIISGENELKIIEENLKNANEINDRNDKIKALNKIYNDYSAILNNNKVEIVALLLLSSETEKETLKNNINIIAQDSKKYLELSKKSLKLAGTTIKKATIEDERTVLLNKINKATETFTQCAKATTTLSRQAKILAALSGIKF